MTYAPHSLLDAAKLVAQAAGVEWATAHRYYRDLQSDPNPWLPKSQGRTIWQAHPHYIARLLIGFGMSETPELAKFAMETVAKMTPGGRQRYLHETDEPLVQQALVPFLIDADRAAQLDRVEFDYLAQSVTIVPRSGDPIVFTSPNADDAFHADVIYRRGVIPGVIFGKIVEAVRWRRYCDAPMEIADSDTGDA